MWISELSEQTGFPVDTIKHYLRVGVLPRGTPIGPQRAEYDESHVERLLLIRALHDVGRLSLDQIRQVFDSVDTSQHALRDAVGQAHMVLSAELAGYREPSPQALRRVDELIERQGWQVEETSTHRRALAVALDTLVSVREGRHFTERPTGDLLDVYAAHLEEIAVKELTYVDTGSRERTINSVVVGTVLFEQLILIIRRLAQQHTSRTWWAEQDWRELPSDS